MGTGQNKRKERWRDRGEDGCWGCEEKCEKSEKRVLFVTRGGNVTSDGGEDREKDNYTVEKQRTGRSLKTARTALWVCAIQRHRGLN